MDRQIPLQFDVQVIDSPLQLVSTEEQNISRLKVAVFTKYRNRNGSYITDEVANQLIETATSGNTPVVGFFDPETKTWASHTGPTLANAYGYVENFIGWEPLTDQDGESRDYAIFSVVLFTDYFEEAKNIIGQNQSMELDPVNIAGDWVEMENEFYFVYSRAKMLGFCIIGNHEPCFSASSFFSKADEEQIDKISELLFSLRKEVEKFEKGGEQPMDENIVQEQETIVEEPVVKEETVVEFAAETEHEAEPEITVEATEIETTVEEAPAEFEAAESCLVIDADKIELGASEFEQEPVVTIDWEVRYNDLQAEFEKLQSNIAALEASMEETRSENETLKSTLATYQAKEEAHVKEQKLALIDQYRKILDEEEIGTIEGNSNDLSYEELESKLAVAFARKRVPEQKEEVKIPLPQPEESQFALLMKKYRKN